MATETTHFVYDGADVVRDLDGNGATIADYLNGPGIDNKLRQTTGTASYFVADHLGTTRALTDATGNINSSLNYDSFGNLSGGPASTRYTHTGREFDSDTGLMYYRARWYDRGQGRFLREDPAGLAGGKNLYTYVDNIPTRFVDPLGLWPSVYPFDTHQRSTARVLGNRLGPKQTELLQAVQYEWDDYSQDENYAFAHAMRMRNESAACARLKANAWVKANIGIARRLDKLGYRNQALWYLGVAIHALQDSTSPEHANFQPAWPNRFWTNFNHLPHYFGESSFDPGRGSELDFATERAYRYFTGEMSIPDDVFGSTYDTSWGTVAFRPSSEDCPCP